MKKQPLVSVGIPTYNRPEGLVRTLKCITKQTYKNLEIIISDNYSKDPRVEDICRSYCKQDKRIKYFRQRKKILLVANFKFVLEKSIGEYFMWAADDDYWDKRYVSVCIKKMQGCKRCVLVATACRVVDPSGKKKDHIDYGLNVNNKRVIDNFKKLRLLMNLRSYINSVCHGIYRTELLRYNFSTINTDIIGADHLLIAKSCLYGPIITIPTVLMIKSRGGVSISYINQAKIMGYKNKLPAMFPFFIREIFLQQVIWQSNKINSIEKINLSFISFIKYLDKLIHSLVNQSVDRVKHIFR